VPDGGLAGNPILSEPGPSFGLWNT
jgi:hypothetical protein